MALPLSILTPGRTVHLRLDGEVVIGAVIATANGWLRLTGADGEILVNLAQVAWIRADGPGRAEPDEATARPRPSPKEVVGQTGPRTPARPWSNDAVRGVIEGFLNDRQDAELAEELGRTRHQITVLRQAWECSRGNIPDDQLSPAAQTWVGRIRSAMTE